MCRLRKRRRCTDRKARAYRLDPRPRDLPLLGHLWCRKFAVEALSDSLRYELSQLGIEVALVQPSAYPTSLFSSMQQPTDAVPESDEEFLQRYVI